MQYWNLWAKLTLKIAVSYILNNNTIQNYGTTSIPQGIQLLARVTIFQR
jgi:hypothetical protein